MCLGSTLYGCLCKVNAQIWGFTVEGKWFTPLDKPAVALKSYQHQPAPGQSQIESSRRHAASDSFSFITNQMLAVLEIRN
jgi:hypothetical protein